MSGRDKARRVEAEIARLTGLFTANTENEKSYVEKQVNQLAWYNVTIADLQKSIDKQGTLVEYANGESQYGTKRNPDIDTLVQWQKLANSIVGNLAKFLKDDTQVGSKLAAFLNVV